MDDENELIDLAKRFKNYGHPVPADRAIRELAEVLQSAATLKTCRPDPTDARLALAYAMVVQRSDDLSGMTARSIASGCLYLAMEYRGVSASITDVAYIFDLNEQTVADAADRIETALVDHIEDFLDWVWESDQIDWDRPDGDSDE